MQNHQKKLEQKKPDCKFEIDDDSDEEKKEDTIIS